jgi:N-terminal acetyltransferase B complex non-catalytic subunit
LIRLYRSTGAISLVKPVLEDLKLSEVQLDTLLHIWIEGAATDAILAPIPRGQELSAWENCAAAMEKMYNRSATDVRPSIHLPYHRREADWQLPEYMKQAIEHGSFSKIHSIRSLASTLANSQTQAAFSIEQTRYRLFKGDPVPRALSGLTRLKSGEMVDSRNWELMPSIGGLRTQVNDLTRLTDGGAEVLEKQAAVLRLLSGDDAIEGPDTVRLYTLSRETAKLTDQGMSASDEAFYGAMTRLSRRMTSSEKPLSGLFDGTFLLRQSS